MIIRITQEKNTYLVKRKFVFAYKKRKSKENENRTDTKHKKKRLIDVFATVLYWLYGFQIYAFGNYRN